MVVPARVARICNAGPVNSHRPREIVQSRAGNGTRTRDPNLGKVVLYQLSYSRTT
jgi:hypothetical protein